MAAPLAEVLAVAAKAMGMLGRTLTLVTGRTMAALTGEGGVTVTCVELDWT